ncbi:hypothetical protein [Parapedobacter soli]|uniref:hypothetical protein n=1 Tax=Parapedobacter soli TaxID=416955 RepID=UPI0021C6CDAA|nr:hypothetical protein [Parapedobacter soli]
MEAKKVIMQLEVKPEVARIFENLAGLINDYTDPMDVAGALDDVMWIYAQAIVKYPEDFFAENEHVRNIWTAKELIRILRGGEFPIRDSSVYSNGDFADALGIMYKYLAEGDRRLQEKNSSINSK